MTVPAAARFDRARPVCPHPGTPHPWLLGGGAAAAAVAVGLSALGGLAMMLAFAAAAAALFLLAGRPVVAVLTAIALVPILSGVRRGFPVPELRISEVIAFALLGMVWFLGWSGWRPRWTGLEWATLAYGVATVTLSIAGAMVSGAGVDLLAAFALLVPFQFVLLSRVVSVVLITPARRRQALRLLLLGSIPVSIVTVLQYLDVGSVVAWTADLTGYDNLRLAVQLGFNPRATGPFDHWHTLAGYLLPVLLVGVSLLLDREQRIMSRPAVLAVLVLGLISLMLTLTFTAVFGLVVGVAVLGLKAGRLGVLARWGVVVAVVAATALAPYIGERLGEQFEVRAGDDRPAFLPETLDYRLDVWQEQYIPAVADSPLLGYGPVLPETIAWKYSESLYLSLQLQGGVLLVLAFAALVWVFLATMSAPTHAADPTVRIPAQVVTAVMVALIPMHAIFPYFASPGMPQVIWILAGVALAGRWVPAAEAVR